MHTTDQAHRIIFIDLMRTIAVLQMVQGHTIDVLLAEQFRSAELPVYVVWHFLRGMTAPIFMFTAGTVFTYLFRSVKKPFTKNYRVKKGVRRAFLLLFLGYMLRYPTWTIFEFSDVTTEQWNLFYSVDVLQLIGFSLLVLLFILFLSEKFNFKFLSSFVIVTTFIFLVSPFVYRIDWISIFPEPLAAYFYAGTGSLFPLFPWAGYVISGGVLGNYLAENPLVFKTTRFSIIIAIFGATFTLIALISEVALENLQIPTLNPQIDPATIFFRIGFVLLLTSVVSFVSLRVDRIPNLIILAGRNTLLIYVVHLIILYGSAWSPGINLMWGRSFSGWEAFIAALIMIALMTLMVLIIHKLKIRNKELVT